MAVLDRWVLLAGVGEGGCWLVGVLGVSPLVQSLIEVGEDVCDTLSVILRFSISVRH